MGLYSRKPQSPTSPRGPGEVILFQERKRARELLEVGDGQRARGLGDVAL